MSNSQSSYRFSAIPQGKSHAAGGSNSVNSESSQYLDDQYPDSLGGDVLSIALIGPDEERRKAAAAALAGCQGGEIREFSSYPPSLDDVPKLLEQQYDVIIIDLDTGTGGEHLRQRHGDGDGLFDEGRFGTSGPLYAGRGARISHLAVCTKHHG
jgi:hypothetical protein